MSALASTTSTASDIRSDYLNLLITQLQNQNPLEPMDNNQMSMQLAQLSQLEQLENISNTFQKVLLSEQSNQATELIGKLVTFFPSGMDTAVDGRVDGVELIGEDVRLLVGKYSVGLDDVQSITDEP